MARELLHLLEFVPRRGRIANVVASVRVHIFDLTRLVLDPTFVLRLDLVAAAGELIGEAVGSGIVR